MKMCVTEPEFLEKYFWLQKLGKLTKNGFVLNLKKTLVIDFCRIRSIMKIYIICSVPAQMLY